MSKNIVNEDDGGAPTNSTGPGVYGTNGETPPMFPKAIEKYKKSNQPLKRKTLTDFLKGK